VAPDVRGDRWELPLRGRPLVLPFRQHEASQHGQMTLCPGRVRVSPSRYGG
jgi:hypothetical protein